MKGNRLTIAWQSIKTSDRKWAILPYIEEHSQATTYEVAIEYKRAS